MPTQPQPEVLSFWEFPDGSRFPVLAGGDGPDVPAPDPQLTATQNELLQLQLQTAKSQAKDYEQVKPLLLEQAGLKFNAETGAYEYIDPAQEASKREIERLHTQRSLAALKGELPVSASLKREIELGKNQLREKLFRQLGPGFETSTPGILALSEFDRMSTSLKEEEQYGRLSTAEALAAGRQQMRTGQGTSVAAAVEAPYAGATRGFLSTGQLLQPAQAYDYNRQRLGLERGIAAGQERGGYVSGAIGAAALTALMMSDPEAKTEIEPVSDGELLAAVRKIPVSKWRYKNDPGKTLMVGGMAPDMPREVAPDGKAFNLVSYLGMLTGAVRALDKKLDEAPVSKGMALALA